MAKKYQTPGMYVEEIRKVPASIEPVDTALPVFIGFTEKDLHSGTTLLNKSIRINSLHEFDNIFGDATAFRVQVQSGDEDDLLAEVRFEPLQFRLYHSLQLFFENGGRSCFICSTGVYPTTVVEADIFKRVSDALRSVAEEASITLILLTDAHLAGEEYYYTLCREALKQCGILKNRFSILDIFATSFHEDFSVVEQNFREKIGDDDLKYGAAYYPYLETTFTSLSKQANTIIIMDDKMHRLWVAENANEDEKLTSLFYSDRRLYESIKHLLSNKNLILPPAAAIAGVYYKVDAERGIWKAPAAVALDAVKKTTVNISENEQQNMNRHHTGKAVNVVKAIPGRGMQVWGTRTLAGNDHEWRYIPVVRFFSWVTQSIKLSIQPFCFEPNNSATRMTIKNLVENFLTDIWQRGGLQGGTMREAFFVRMSLNQPMTETNILESKMLIEIGMAALRPAEFTIVLVNMEGEGS